MKKGHTMAARISGKIKAWVYAIAGGAGIAQITCASILELKFLIEPMNMAANVLYIATGLTAVWTLIDYALTLKESKKK